ncbi:MULTISPECIES: hypothetical protein [unclassified Aureimonas]|uniref:hypothetical protein n=1 Tax=unclassified Aureimonas TaxID=2615206 RepID=UPI0006FD1B4D|nr:MULTISPECIES: hypothetical protein [unclassified Aureimonas]KQT66095.1 hypothetical protein ASG62_19990 [Aureimonas sp. Leaf427]KQT81041.1 hypothetical protein ASG54_06260 [Aureimonas sp. Leaf460]
MEAVLTQAIQRLEAVLAGETNALRVNAGLNLAETTNRKNQSLLELSRISRGVDPRTVTPALKEKLDVLRWRLDENSRVLKLHMAATQEISNLIARAMANAESDGTYGSSIKGVKRDT